MAIPSERNEDCSDCALPDALEIMGEKWAFMILRTAFDDVRHFEEFLSKIGIARNILASRLSKLTGAGILHRTPCPDDKRKVEYRLTEKGIALLPTMIALRQWGEQWATCVPSNPVLVDKYDRQPIQQIAIRSHDGRILTNNELRWVDGNEVNMPGAGDGEKAHQLKAI